MSRNAKILLAVVLVVFVLLPALAFGGLMVTGGAAWFLVYREKQHAVAEMHLAEMTRNVAELAEEVDVAQARGDAIASCGSEEEARAAAEKEPTLRHAPAPCLVDLGMYPDPVIGRYWVEVHPDGITVGGVEDADGDGQPAVVTAAPGQDATVQTPDGIY